MQMNPFCMCCAVNKQEKGIRKFQDADKKVEYMKKVMALIADAGDEDCAPSLSLRLKELYSQYWNENAEDYSGIKHEFNRLMLDLEDRLEQNIRSSRDPLETALLYARIGNYIDFAALSHVDKDTVLSMIEAENKAPLDALEYAHFLEDLSHASSLVYFTDNCGEIVLDKLAVRILQEQYPRLSVTVVVRGLPIVNDATMEDAVEVGLTSYATVIGNGSGVAGTWLPDINAETRSLLDSADVILAKGQGNFETLNGCGRNIYYLFLCKCEWFQKLFHAEPLEGMFVNEQRVTPDR